MMTQNDLKNIKEIFASKKKAPTKKPPAYEWQEFALHIIEELNIPKSKRNSVFKVCRDHDKAFLERCLNDTKELCKSGEKWKYFFKLIAQR